MDDLRKLFENVTKSKRVTLNERDLTGDEIRMIFDDMVESAKAQRESEARDKSLFDEAAKLFGCKSIDALHDAGCMVIIDRSTMTARLMGEPKDD